MHKHLTIAAIVNKVSIPVDPPKEKALHRNSMLLFRICTGGSDRKPHNTLSAIQGNSFPKINKMETSIDDMAKNRGNSIRIADVKVPLYFICCERNTDRYNNAQATLYERMDA